MTKKRVAVLISGNGSNLQALIDAARAAEYPAEIALVISNKADAYGLERAKQAGITRAVISHKDYPTREAFDAALHNCLSDQKAELVCLAGFMRLLTPWFVERWHDRLVNIHPSLLPEYKGLDTHARVLADGKVETGCTVHFVRPEMDVGPIIVQRRVAVEAGDNVETLAARVHAAEHIAYPEALRLVASGAVRVENEQVVPV